jgi:hypothetical protein
MKYVFDYVGDFQEATPREMMLQNIQEMVYIKYKEGLTFRQLATKLEEWAARRGGEEISEAVKDWLDYNRQQNAHLMDAEESLQLTEGEGCLQFDLRPVRE